MKDWHIYLKTSKDKTTGRPYKTRRYYRGKLKGKQLTDRLTYVGSAKLSDDYFIVGSETHHTDIIDLNSVELQYTATMLNGKATKFSHTIQELLEKAKEGILPYISFEGHKVSRQRKLIINGKLHETKSTTNLEVSEG